MTAALVVNAQTPEPIATKDFAGGLYRTDDLFIAGQPLTVEAIKALKAEGATTVVNIRTPEEMKSQGPFSREHEIVESLGMTYVHIPTGGPDYPYSPAAVEKFSRAVAQSSGPVLLHCASGRRASHLWVAYLTTIKGLSLEEAVQLGKQVNFGSQPVEGFLGDEVEYSLKGETSPN